LSAINTKLILLDRPSTSLLVQSSVDDESDEATLRLEKKLTKKKKLIRLRDIEAYVSLLE